MSYCQGCADLDGELELLRQRLAAERQRVEAAEARVKKLGHALRIAVWRAHELGDEAAARGFREQNRAQFDAMTEDALESAVPPAAPPPSDPLVGFPRPLSMDQLSAMAGVLAAAERFADAEVDAWRVGEHSEDRHGALESALDESGLREAVAALRSSRKAPQPTSGEEKERG